MKWTGMFYALTVAMMVMVATGTATLVSASTNTKQAAFASLVLERAHAEESAPAPAVEQPAPAPAVEEPAPVDDGAFFQSALKAVGDILAAVKQEGSTKVAIALSVLLIISQLLIQLTKTALFGKIFPKANGAGKLLIVSVCGVVTTFVPMVLAGVPWGQALVSGGVLSAIMVAGHQVYQNFFEKKA